MSSVDDIPARIRALIEAVNLPTPYAFAASVGLPQQSISNMLTGKVKPSAATLVTIVERYPHLNLTWLLNGTGEPFPNGVHGEKLPVAPVAPPDVEAAQRETRLARASLAATRATLTAKEAYIAQLEAELGKSSGSAEQPAAYSPTPKPNGPRTTGATRYRKPGFVPTYMLAAGRRVRATRPE